MATIACANPRCDDTSDTLFRCGACYCASYCCRSCQRQHWRQHKALCSQRACGLKHVASQWLAAPQCRAYDKELVASFAKSCPLQREMRAGIDLDLDHWIVRVTKARLLKKSPTDPRDNTHVGWKRDLNLTLHAGQELPEALFGDSSLELRLAGRVRLSFCALDAMRCWALLDHPPPPHLGELQNKGEESVSTGSHGWDYTFTTKYKGAIDNAPLGRGLPAHPGPRRCDSLYSRPAIDLACGKTQLRKVLCRCVNPRPLLTTTSFDGLPRVDVGSHREASAKEVHESDKEQPPPSWTSEKYCHEKSCTDIFALLKNDPRVKTPFCDTVDLWLDNLDPHSLSFLRVSVLVAESFWAVQLRCFVRVNGVMARVVDTKMTCRFAEGQGRGCWVVHREHAWREGTWRQLVASIPSHPSSSHSHVDLGGIGDRLAAERLPVVRPAEFHRLELPRTDSVRSSSQSSPSASPSAPHPQPLCPRLLWRKSVRSEALAVGGALAVLVSEDGSLVEVIDVLRKQREAEGEGRDESTVAGTGAHTLWSWSSLGAEDARGVGAAAVLSVALSTRRVVSAQTTRLLALGDDRGTVHLWDAATGHPITRFAVAVPCQVAAASSDGGGHSNSRNTKSIHSRVTRGWVDQLCWSHDGNFLAASAGRVAVVASVALEAPASAKMQGEVQVVDALRNESSGSTVTGTVSSIAALHDRHRFAVGGYGGVQWLENRVRSTCSVNYHCSTAECDGARAGRPMPRCAPLAIGTTATLAVAASPDGRFLAVGCLDKRMRVFNLLHAAGRHEGAAVSASAQGREQRASCCGGGAEANCKPADEDEARDWVGFDGPVGRVAWSAAGAWLAAAGGSALLVVERGLAKGEPPVRCVLPGNGKATVADFAWCPCLAAEALLAAIEAPVGRAHIFGVGATHTDGAVPRRAMALLTVEPAGSAPSPQLLKVAFVAQAAVGVEAGGEGVEEEDKHAAAVIISHGDSTVAVAVPKALMK